MKYVLMEYADKCNYTASNKAREDAVKILVNNNAIYVPLFRAKSGHIRILFSIMKCILMMLFRLQKDDTLYIQYPYNPPIANDILIRSLSICTKIHGAVLCILMHDINSFRFSSDSQMQSKMRKEAMLLNNANHVIAHNNRMIELLRNCGCSAQMHDLQYFYYLWEGPLAYIENGITKHIIIAGNLAPEKSGYVYNLPANSVQYELFGVNYDTKRRSGVNVHYNGAFAPDDLIPHLKGSFGLVWDGTSTQTCEGNYGVYLRYNNPHKFSLYIAAGLPVIVWSESALAD